MKISRIQTEWAIVLCSACAYILSLFIPALLLANGAPIVGRTILAVGWLGILDREFAWFANPAYFFAAIAYMLNIVNKSIGKRLNTIDLFLSVVALLLGLTAFHAKLWYYGESLMEPIIGLGIGFYVWMLSFFILLIGRLIPYAPNLPTPRNEGASVS